MEDEFMYIILIILIIIIYHFNKKNKIAYIKNKNTNKIIDINKVNDQNNIIHKKKIILTQGDVPEFRGFIDKYRNISISEKGGAKPYYGVLLNDYNLKANNVNYTKKYNSYRKKPFYLKK